jgi:hypothetical protein
VRSFLTLKYSNTTGESQHHAGRIKAATAGICLRAETNNDIVWERIASDPPALTTCSDALQHKIHLKNTARVYLGFCIVPFDRSFTGSVNYCGEAVAGRAVSCSVPALVSHTSCLR